jgi:hypothetical protein
MLGVGQRVSPRLTDRYLERHAVEEQASGKPLPPDRRDNLYAPVEHDGGESGHSWEGRVLRRSVFTAGRLHPKRAGCHDRRARRGNVAGAPGPASKR